MISNIINVFFRSIYIIFIIIKYNLITLIPSKNKIIVYLISNFFNLFFKKTYSKTRGIRIKLAFEDLGPLFIKLGQLLSIRIDLIPEDINKELKKLQTNVTVNNFNNVKHIIEKEYNCSINDIFKKININPIASASIAQIHTGVLKNNENIIIKIIKPNIRKIIKKDINILMFISKIANTFFLKRYERLKLIEIVFELNNMLNNELDLKKEAANSIKLKQNLKNLNTIYIPNIKWEYTNKNILMMEYITGINITNIKKLKKKNINTDLISKNLIEFFYIQTFKHRFFHADLHPGNLLITNINKNIITLLDFGIVSSLKIKEKEYLSENILAFSQRDYRKVAYLHMKQKKILNNNLIDDFEKEICYICEPILNKPIKDISFEKTLKLLLNLTKKFKLETHPKLILFQKTLMTIEGLSRNLNPNINLWKITRQSIEKIIISNNLTEELQKNIINKIIKTIKIINYKEKIITIKKNKYLKVNKLLNISLGYIIGILFSLIIIKYNNEILTIIM